MRGDGGVQWPPRKTDGQDKAEVNLPDPSACSRLSFLLEKWPGQAVGAVAMNCMIFLELKETLRMPISKGYVLNVACKF